MTSALVGRGLMDAQARAQPQTTQLSGSDGSSGEHPRRREERDVSVVRCCEEEAGPPEKTDGGSEQVEHRALYDDDIHVDVAENDREEKGEFGGFVIPDVAISHRTGSVMPVQDQVRFSSRSTEDDGGDHHRHRHLAGDEAVDAVSVQLELDHETRRDCALDVRRDVEETHRENGTGTQGSLHQQLDRLHIRAPTTPTSRLGNMHLAAVKTARTSIYQVLRQPVDIVTQFGQSTSQVSAYVTRTAASFNKKALKSNALKVTEHSHLKLGTLTTSDISTLYVWFHFIVVAVPLLQVLYGFYASARDPRYGNQNDLGDNGVWSDATIQAIVLLTSTLFIQRIAFYRRRQRIQLEILGLAGCSWVFSALSLASNTWNAMHPTAESSRELMGVTNTLMAGLLYRTLTHFSDFYTDLVAGWSAIEHRSPNPGDRKEEWCWLKCISGERFAHVLPLFILSYMGVRLALGWRSSVVFDFLPMTNVITPARLIYIHGKRIQQPNLLVDSIVVTVHDAILLGVACYKCSCAHRSFRHIFVQDFARVFTEFGVFVLYFRDIILYMAIGGHIAAWTVPFDRLFSPVDWDESTNTIRVVQMGAVQQQLGFLLCFAVWLGTIMYCALPEDSVGLKGWFAGSNAIKHKHQAIKYFLYESDVYMKTKFTNLKDIEEIDPSHFIMDKQVEAFNFAQLVYACGKHESSFTDSDLEIAHIQKLVGNPQFTIVDIIQDRATDTHCLVVESPTTIVVAFRGTSSKTNAKTDLNAAMSEHRTAKQLDFTKMPSLSGRSRLMSAKRLSALAQTKRTWWHRLLCKRNPPKVHSGFYAAYLSVEKRVLTRIKELHDQEPRKILATGHSLGGALAALCSFDVVAQLKIANVTCTTFGSPRIGNTSFKKKYNHAVPATFAFVNAADLVTKLPPKTPKALSYTSVGTVVLINAFGNLVIAPNVLELTVLHKGYSAKAHMLKAYHLSLLLWCLRSHRMQYHPRFWRQPREFLEANYGHLAEIQAYLKVSTVERAPRAGRLHRWCQVRDTGEPTSGSE